MGILDDAIKEHLDLKRQHGARDSELQEIEDDAFGSGDRPDPFASGDMFAETGPPAQGGPSSDEALAPGKPAPERPGEDVLEEEPTRLVEPEAAAQAPPAEAPPPEPAFPDPGGQSTSSQPPTPAAEPEQELPAPAGPPPESESLAELMAQDKAEAPELTDEAVADRPDLSEPEQEEVPAGPEADLEPEPQADLEPDVDPEPEAEAEPEPDLSVPDPPPPPPLPEPGTEPPGRARGRVHHPTEEHPSLEHDVEQDSAELLEAGGPPSGEPLESAGPPSGAPLRPEGASASPAESVEPAEPEGTPETELYDFETDEGSLDPEDAASAAPATPEPPAPAPADDFEELGPATDEAPHPDEEEPQEDDQEPAVEETGDDLLSESPEFLEGEPEEGEGEDLWFEKGPPKDFDFEDE